MPLAGEATAPAMATPRAWRGVLREQIGGGRRGTAHKRPRIDSTLVTVELGHVEVAGKGELLGRDTRRTHIVKLADVVA